MSNLRQWLDDGAPPEVTRLLRAGLEENPQRERMQRTLLAVGVAGAAATAANLSSAATVALDAATAVGSHSAAASTLGVLAKWSMIGLLSVGATVATVQVVRQQPPHATPAAVAVRAQLLAPLPTASAPSFLLNDRADNTPALPEPNAATVRAGRGAGTTLPPAVTANADRTMAQEIELIDQARAALRSSNAAATLRLVNDYGRRFPAGRLAPEALYLRMEAYLKAGDQQNALAAARRLVDKYPQCPQVARAKDILNSSNYPRNL
jgi:hypothetical protein